MAREYITRLYCYVNRWRDQSVIQMSGSSQSSDERSLQVAGHRVRTKRLPQRKQSPVTLLIANVTAHRYAPNPINAQEVRLDYF